MKFSEKLERYYESLKKLVLSVQTASCNSKSESDSTYNQAEIHKIQGQVTIFKNGHITYRNFFL